MTLLKVFILENIILRLHSTHFSNNISKILESEEKDKGGGRQEGKGGEENPETINSIFFEVHF